MKKWKNKHLKWMVAWIIAGLIIVFIPRGIDELFSRFQIQSNFESDQWLGFLGGYLGAIIGGIATLVAVLISLNGSQKNQEKSELKENSLIVYYDIILGLEDLKKLYYNYKYPNKITVPSKLFFSNDWIKNVAKLSSEFKDIDRLYLLYGDFEMLKQEIDNLSLNKGAEKAILFRHKNSLNRIINRLGEKVFVKDIFEPSGDYKELKIENDFNDAIKSIVTDLEKLKDSWK